MSFFTSGCNWAMGSKDNKDPNGSGSFYWSDKGEFVFLISGNWRTFKPNGN
jgi:hypothetical protein